METHFPPLSDLTAVFAIAYEMHTELVASQLAFRQTKPVPCARKEGNPSLDCTRHMHVYAEVLGEICG